MDIGDVGVDMILCVLEGWGGAKGDAGSRGGGVGWWFTGGLRGEKVLILCSLLLKGEKEVRKRLIYTII